MNFLQFAFRALRSLVFFSCLLFFAVAFVLVVSVLMPFLSFRQRYAFLTFYGTLCVFLLRFLCGVRWEVQGLENLPKCASVICSKHQSPWEVFFFPPFLYRTTGCPSLSIAKRELLWIPLLGWGFFLAGTIFINRAKGGQAIKTILRSGGRALQNGCNIIIFPEGTRTVPGQNKPFNRGAAHLAVQNNVPMIPISLDSGHCWAPRNPVIRPGKITVRIGPAIHTETHDGTNHEVRALTEEAQKRVESLDRRE